MAGLVTQSLRHLEQLNYGFQTRGRVIIELSPQNAGYKAAQLPGLYQSIRDRLGHVPGVLSLGYSLYSPQDGDSWTDDVFIQGRTRESTQDTSVTWLRVSPDYFKTIGTPVIRGRAIGEQDTATSQRVVVVDESFVKKFFPGQDPIGQHFGFAQDGHSGDYEIVGVVKDTQYRDPTGDDKQNPMFFLGYFQTVQYQAQNYQRMDDNSQYIKEIELQVAGDPANLVPQLRNTLAGIDPNLSITDVRTMTEQVDRVFNQQRLLARLTELFSLLALLLASIGLYGVTAYNIARRTSEIGIRMAVGADRKDIVAMVLRGAFGQVGIGLIVGVPLVIVAGRLMSSKLYGVGTFNPLTTAAAILALAFCAFIAGLVPARRAASIEPVRALRIE